MLGFGFVILLIIDLRSEVIIFYVIIAMLIIEVFMILLSITNNVIFSNELLELLFYYCLNFIIINFINSYYQIFLLFFAPFILDFVI
jgi:hypothetical protein